MATIYTVCKQSMQPRSLKDLCLACPEVKKKDLGKKILMLQKILAGDNAMPAPSGTGGHNSHLVASYVDQHCGKFGIGEHITMFAREIVQSCDERKCLDGSPVSLAAAVLFICMAADAARSTAASAGKGQSMKLKMGSPTASTEVCDSLSMLSTATSELAVETMRDVCSKCSVDRATVEGALNRIRPALSVMFLA